MSEVEYQRIQIVVERLRVSGRLPEDADVYDPRLDVFKFQLAKDINVANGVYRQSTDIPPPLRDSQGLAEKMEREHPPAGYIAWEALKQAYLDLASKSQYWSGKYVEYGEVAANRAFKILQQPNS